MHCTCSSQDYEEEYESRQLNGVENDTVPIDTLKTVAVDVNDDDVPQESVCSSGYESNGTSASTGLSSAVEEAANTLQNCHMNTEREEVVKSAPAETVIRRPKNVSDKISSLQSQRASYPAAGKQALACSEQPNLNGSFGSSVNSSNASIERLTTTDDDEAASDAASAAAPSKPSKPLPEWVVVGESVLVRPYNWSGVISFIGTTQFASGKWIGVSLDAATGKAI